MNELINLYPFNLASKIFGNDSEALKLFVPGLELALQTLTTRERECVTAKYQDRKTLREIGVSHGVSQERARQIIEKAIRKLRHPRNAQQFRGTSYAKIAELKQENTVLRQQLRDLEVAFTSITEKLKTNTTPTAIKASGILLEDVNLSVRAFNIFYRKGIRTLGEVADLSTYELMHLRNMGVKTCDEIINVLHSHGLCLADESMADSK